MTQSTLAAVAAAATAAAQPGAPPATPAAPAAPAPAAAAAPAAPAPTAAPAAPSAPALSAATALELAALAIPSAREQLSTLAAAAGEGATEASYRAACMGLTGSAPAEPLRTAPPTPAVKKPDEKPQAAAIPAPGDIYGARAKAMAAD